MEISGILRAIRINTILVQKPHPKQYTKGIKQNGSGSK